MKKIYTTGEVAKLLGININTVIKWFDEGKVLGFRLPGSRERRITRSALINFMRENEIPLELIDETFTGQDRRSIHRFATNIPVNFLLNDKSCAASVTNISESGALVTVPGNLADRIRFGSFNLKLNFTGKPLEGMSTGASIANVRPMDSQIGLGVRFDPGNENLRLRIRELYSKAESAQVLQ